MRMNKSNGALIALALAACVAATVITRAAGEVAGAGAAPYPTGTTFNLVSVRAMQFGLGAAAAANGPATGDFHVTLLGTSVLGQSQVITYDGTASAVSVIQGAATLSGTGMLDMGDGSVPAVGVPFTATATPNSLLLVLGTTTLPTATLTEGRITIE
jgi:hypothetical protein